MNKNLIWKFVLIFVLLLLCVLQLNPFSQTSSLKPGIDLAGGTSLLYQIDTTGMGSFETRDLAQTMIRILKQRVDPANTRNLIMRAIGNDRIEIQMPLATDETKTKREKYQEKLQVLTKNNIDLRKIHRAMIKPVDQSLEDYRAKRTATFETLAADSPERLERLNQLAQAYDAYTVAEEKLAADWRSTEELRVQLQEANISINAVDAMVKDWDDLDDPNRQKRLETLAQDDNAEEMEKKKTLITNFITARHSLSQSRPAAKALSEALAEAWSRLEQLNIDIDRLEKILPSLADARSRNLATTQIEEIKTQHPELAQNMDELIAGYLEYTKVQGRLDDAEDLKRLLRGSGVLEFRILPTLGELSQAETQRYMEALTKYGPTLRSGDENYVWRKIKNPEDFRSDVIRQEFAGQEYVLMSNSPEETMLHESGPDAWSLKKAWMGTDNLGRWAVHFMMSPIGAGRFFELTSANRNRPLCIMLDDQAVSAPNIKSAISRMGIIEGQFSAQEVQDLADKLNAGSLPARLSEEPISVYTVGPTMGKDNLEAGLRAGIIGLIAVAGFMVCYYLFSGVLSGLALFLNLLLILSVMAFSQATFTMAGIAGVILTIGMAVDANVLIFERIREEQNRGSSIRMAIKNGYDRALRTILDANITTFITGLILWMVASEEVKGFALTLMIGIVSSVFTALFVTRTIFDLMTGRRWLKDKLHMLRIIGTAHVNWMSARKLFFTVSGLLMIGGWVVFVGRDEEKNSKYSIEFTGGTSIVATLNENAQDLDRSQIEQRVREVGAEIGNDELKAAVVQRIGEPEKREFEIVTTATNIVEVNVATPTERQVTIEQLRGALQKAAKTFGDRRMAEARIYAQQNPGEFRLETNQTNLNTIHRVVAGALDELSGVTYEIAASKDAPGTLITFQTPGVKDITAEQLLEMVVTQAKNQGYERLAEAAISPAPTPGQFVVQTEETDDTLIDSIMKKIPAPLAGFTYDIGATQAVVTDAVRKALEGKLNVQDNLEPTNIQSQPITDELLAKKPYINIPDEQDASETDFTGGLLLTVEFGGGKTDTWSRLLERFEQSFFVEDFKVFGNNKLKLFTPNDAHVDDTTPLQALEVAVISPELLYDSSEPEEFQQFQQNEQKRLGAILERATSLTRVNQIDPSVGQKSMNQALVAVVLSLGAIIMYIWIRFGNVRFGLAAVAALVHDVSIAMGLVAASAWLSTTAIGRALLISDFKIDPPMIAAFLTVIGYSLNDTIVVFDRIRENRGKMALLSPDVINSSINQTLSRTILTSWTTLMVLVIMYIWGGPGLRGFNYVLIIGIVVGTYSSIGIASPLLYGAQAAPAYSVQPVRKAKGKESL